MHKCQTQSCVLHNGMLTSLSTRKTDKLVSAFAHPHLCVRKKDGQHVFLEYDASRLK